MTSQNKNTIIMLPSDLVEAIEKKINGTDFESVSSYITYLIRQVLNKTNQEKTKEKELTKEEENIKKNLHAMGYL